MADMELENNVVINKGSPRMLFDLNGHTITVGDNATCVFSIEEIGSFYTLPSMTRLLVSMEKLWPD